MDCIYTILSHHQQDQEKTPRLNGGTPLPLRLLLQLSCLLATTQLIYALGGDTATKIPNTIASVTFSKAAPLG